MVEKKQFVKRISKKKKILCHKDTKPLRGTKVKPLCVSLCPGALVAKN